jgi:hypothetical protein
MKRYVSISAAILLGTVVAAKKTEATTRDTRIYGGDTHDHRAAKINADRQYRQKPEFISEESHISCDEDDLSNKSAYIPNDVKSWDWDVQSGRRNRDRSHDVKSWDWDVQSGRGRQNRSNNVQSWDWDVKDVQSRQDRSNNVQSWDWDVKSGRGRQNRSRDVKSWGWDVEARRIRSATSRASWGVESRDRDV